MDCKIEPGTWKELKSQLKLQFSNLEEDDLEVGPGRESELINKIKLKSGRDEDEVINIIIQIEKNLRARNLK